MTMSFGRIVQFTVVGLAFWCASATASKSEDDAVLGAYKAFRAWNAARLAQHASTLKGHILEPYAEYWQLRLRLDSAKSGEIHDFLARHSGSYLAERLRLVWVRSLGRRGAWKQFEVERKALERDDFEVRCHALHSLLARGRIAALQQEKKSVWLRTRKLPEACNPLVEKLFKKGLLGVDDVWDRVRVLFENGKYKEAKSAVGRLPVAEIPDEKRFAQASKNAKSALRLLSQVPLKVDTRPAREVTILAAVRLTRANPAAAADALKGSLGKALSEKERKYIWGQIAMEAARRHYGDARKWYGLAGATPLSDEQVEWKTRAGLRFSDWRWVRGSIDAMPKDVRKDPAWSYWYGRALRALGNGEGAKAYFTRIAGETDFYSVLASEELGYVIELPKTVHNSTEAQVTAAGRIPGIARALELYRLDLRSEAVREWVYAVRGLDDAQLLAAAELARRAGHYDRAINTADLTRQDHNFKMRYLAPFKEIFSEYSRTQGLEEAWVLGLVRQESRFIADARSWAGAKGLMQLMPRTARWVARKIGLEGFRQRDVMEVETNVTLGTGYLKMVLDALGHPVLASAGYNAGPGRAWRWRGVASLEGAVYVETIPFDETRDYVKKVMSNALFYSLLLSERPATLKERLGTIKARAPNETLKEKLP